MGNKLVNFTVERTPFSPQYVYGDFKKQDSGNIHEGPNFNCHSLHLQCHCFDRRTNHGTPRLLHKKVQRRC